MQKKSFPLAELAQLLEADLKGDPDCLISGMAPLDKASPGQISFLHNPQYQKFLTTTNASAVVIAAKDVIECRPNLLVVKNPYLGYAQIANLFAPQVKMNIGIHSSVTVGENTQISSKANIGPQCVIGDNVIIGPGTTIHPGCTIGNDTSIGSDCVLWANVAVYHGVCIGDRVIAHSGVVIGSDGFGMVNDKGVWYKIPQIGGVIIGDDVEIGANTCIDRGALENTVIENGVKLDNLIQIAHNVHIGAHTAIAGCTAIAGSTHIGKHCMIGGGAAINGHIKIADGVILTATAAVSSSITEPGVYSSGIPVQPNKVWRRNMVRFLHLDELARRVNKLEKNIP